MPEISSLFAEVLLPLPVPRTFTYGIPPEFQGKVAPGIRVVVQFGKRKIYAGVVTGLHGNRPSYELKEILTVLDEQPVVAPVQMELWNWIAKYYLCQPGEVMNAALPSALKLSSESRVRLDPDAEYNASELNEKELLLLEALHNRETIEVSEIPKILEQQKVLPVIKTLLDKGLLKMEEEVEEKYRPRTEIFVRLSDTYLEDENLFREMFDSLEKRAKKQLELLMAFLALSRYGSPDMQDVPRSQLLKKAGLSSAILEGLTGKGVLEIYEKRVEAAGKEPGDFLPGSIELAGFQQQAMKEIKTSLETKDVVLLHGVTSSGKTEMYIRLIGEAIEQGKQVLYLLPEIALTTQIIDRLKKYFGGKVGVYHSRFHENERAEIWNSVLKGGFDVILGARSAVFLPFTKLGLVIVDEEHDPSFKQYDPSPRYNGRDVALYLAHLHGAKTILGSATPSIESYYNAREGKYALVQMTERYGNMEMPEIEIVDIRQELRWRKMRSHYSSVLLNQLEAALANHEQSILFQNRRGFSLRIECETCHWMPMCKNCDVTLVYHKKSDHLRCHYCGYTMKVPSVCPSCGGKSLKMQGFGTEKVEEELKILLPGAKIARMDLDTTRSRQAYRQILTGFEERKIDILVGTQMVTKGLDFENVSTVCILNADNMLSFPDFRSAERSFQLMEQVSGRSGRKNKRGKVIIQTFNPKHPIIANVVNHDYLSMYNSQMEDRKKFRYPPFYRLILVKVRHRDPAVLAKASEKLGSRLKKLAGFKVLGPEYPLVSKIMNYYYRQIMVKIDRNSAITSMKDRLMKELEAFEGEREWSAIRLIIDVDPQ